MTSALETVLLELVEQCAARDPEPPGGAHANHDVAAAALKASLVKHLDELRRLRPDKLVRRRRDKFVRMGRVAG